MAGMGWEVVLRERQGIEEVEKIEKAFFENLRGVFIAWRFHDAEDTL
jgi:hypothetical protein